MKCPKCGKILWFLRNFCAFCKTAITAPPRPKSVGVLCWTIIALSLVALVSAAVGSVMPPARSDRPFEYAFFYAGPIFCLGSALFILPGHNWARWLLVLWLGCNAGMSAILHSTPIFLAGRVLMLVIAGYYLFRPAATAFFTEAASLAEGLPEGKAECRECGKVFPVEEMISHDGRHICAACKPSLLQKISEGVPPGVPE